MKLVCERAYAVTVFISMVAGHPEENRRAFRALVDLGPSDGSEHEADGGCLSAVWGFPTPEEASAWHEQVMKWPCCGMTIDLTMSVDWFHAPPGEKQ